jgi:hypothetical protein
MYKPVLKEFNGAPIFEILRNGQPWNDDLPFAGKTHFSFGVRKARSIIHAEVLIRQYVSSMGAGAEHGVRPYLWSAEPKLA